MCTVIVTVTLNPLLEHRYTVDRWIPGGNHRNADERLAAGGKGLNVSRQLQQLGAESMALLFLGGENGRTVRKILSEEKINFTAVSTKSETRRASVITGLEQSQVSTFFGKNSEVSKREAEEFRDKLIKIIKTCEILILSGSSPSPEADIIFPAAIHEANKQDKIVILDTYGRHMDACVAEGPRFLHNNLREAEEHNGAPLDTEEKQRQYLLRLYKQGVKQAFLTDGGQPTLAANFDYHYRLTGPAVEARDETGSGDAFTAGIAYGLFTDMIFDDYSKLAAALGAANAASYGTCRSGRDEYGPLVGQCSLETVGKKMKLVDVTPRY